MNILYSQFKKITGKSKMFDDIAEPDSLVYQKSMEYSCLLKQKLTKELSMIPRLRDWRY